MNAWATLFATAARRHGIVTMDDVRASGLPPVTFRHRARAEGWPHLHQGVWAVPGAPDTPLRECAAASAAAAPALLARRSAGWLWGLRSHPPVTPELLMPHTAARRRHPGIVVLRSRSVTEADAATIRGLAVTTVARTLGDLAAVSSLDRLLGLVVTARQRELVTLDALAAQVAAMRKAPGIQRLRQAVNLLADEHVDSLLERDVRRGIAAAGLPPPSREPLWIGSGSGRLQIDIAWPERHVGIEVDGFAYHHRLEDLHRDHRKGNVAAGAGWVLLRVGYLRWRNDRHAFLAEVAHVLSRRSVVTSGR